MHLSRRTFLYRSAGAGATLVAGERIAAAETATSYRSVAGANEKIRLAVMGVNSRGMALARSFARQPNAEISHICDVDSRAIAKTIEALAAVQERKPKGEKDFRKALEDKDVDALVIAAPDHWHAPATLLACQAGKHVYVEKPCSHNPREGEILTEAARRYRKVVQMGSQRRSWPNVRQAIQSLHEGIIGKPYLAKSWYTNKRQSIGFGKEAPVPEWLDYDLWQGPAPRRPYRDNLIHYNWHWFWHWGTGEALNNGTHMIDLMRWGLNVDYPVRVFSTGGRFHFQDDWETPDTQVITADFASGCTMMFESRSCNQYPVEGRSVGVIFYGQKGSMLIDGNSYTIYDENDKVVREIKDSKSVDPRNPVNPAESLDGIHLQNFLQAITGKGVLHAEITEGHRSTLICQLGNISYRVQRSMDLDPKSGKPLKDAEALKHWDRAYQPGWEMKL